MLRRHGQSGFTLIELMVSLLVAAVLVALAAPSFRDLVVKSRLRGATDAIVNLFNTARTSAVKMQRDVIVSLQGTTTWCGGAAAAAVPTIGDPVLSATACDCVSAICPLDNLNAKVSSSDYSNVSVAVASAVDYGSVNQGVTFNSKLGAIDLGSAPATNAPVVTLTSGRYTTQVYLYPLGQTYVCVPGSSPFVSGYPSC
ncbi:MAG TPA: prepilin-type N-terminal cleavage/methylation domain-containing protein [Rudaea sp.]|jgi:prepilin-type N-terminal cleavage/methylation domain-containing protein